MNVDLNSQTQQIQGVTGMEYYHQQYLAKNPNGYCGLSGCNVRLNDFDEEI